MAVLKKKTAEVKALAVQNAKDALKMKQASVRHLKALQKKRRAEAKKRAAIRHAKR